MGRTFGSVRGRIVVPGGELDGAVVHLAGGRIERIERPGAPVPPAPGRLDLPGCRVYPGWINLHVHGAMGRDFIDPEAGAAEAIARYLATQGFSGFLATYMTCSKEALGRALGHLATLVAARRPDVSAPLGVHLEGPFLDPAKKGSQPEEHLAPPSVELLDALLANVPDGLKVLMTLAPELPGADRVVDALLARGAVPAIGHTQATYARTMEAIRRGARHAVHLLNAMRPLHHREPGVVGAFLTTPGTTVEIIPDLVHLHPAIVRLVMALRGPDGVVLATDSIAPTGLGEGERLWAGRTVRVRGGRATLRDGTMAGSVLETARMLANLRELGVKAPDVARMLSTNPARVLGLGAERGEIAEGKRTDLTVVDGDDRVTLVVSDGHAVWAAPELGL
ncbi:MAG: N-acetylglucosamine-6-phosphate deacetylase, partial [Candidatus Riflebacteria bacterium]|nr:N-acetylglucosamine-6-phosphate deacetylase [Candidatus Riflebacteria bacterium]